MNRLLPVVLAFVGFSLCFSDVLAVPPENRNSQQLPRRPTPESQKTTDAELLHALSSDNAGDRQKAVEQLRKRGEKNRKALLQLLADDEKPLTARIAALDVLQSFWNKDVSKAFIGLLTHPKHELRRLAAEGLGRNTKKGDQQVTQELVLVLNERDPEVLCALVLAIGRIGAEGAADSLVNVLLTDKSKNSRLRAGIIRAIESLGKPGIDALMNLSNSGQPRDLDLVVETFLVLRTRPAAAALPTLLKNYHLDTDQRAKLLRSYRNYMLDPPVSLEPVVVHLNEAVEKTKKITTAKELQQAEALRAVKLAALKVLSSAKKLKSEKVGKVLITLLETERYADVRIAGINTVAELRINKAGPVLASMLVEGSLRSTEERHALIKALGTLKDKAAVKMLVKMLNDKKLPATEEMHIIQGDGLRALAMIDSGEAIKVARSFLDSSNVALQKQAVAVLGTEPAGAKLVGEKFLAGKLPRQLVPNVVRALRPHAAKNPELAKLLAKVKQHSATSQ